MLRYRVSTALACLRPSDTAALSVPLKVGTTPARPTALRDGIVHAVHISGSAESVYASSTPRAFSMPKHHCKCALIILAVTLPMASGCTAVSVASTAGSAAVSVTTGAVKATGKTVAAVGRAVTPSDKEGKDANADE